MIATRPRCYDIPSWAIIRVLAIKAKEQKT